MSAERPDDELDELDEEVTGEITAEVSEPLTWWRRFGPGLLKGLGVALAAVVVMTLVGWLRSPSLPEQAPDFTLPDLDGATVTLEELRGRPVVLNFWATWCGPCRVEAPALSRFDQRHDDIVVLGIATDGSSLALRKASRDLGITYRVLRADRSTVEAYGVSTLPTTVFVDAEGAVVTSYTGLMLDPQLEALALGL